MGATRKIFVGGLTQNSTEESLREFFNAYGPVEEVIIMYGFLLLPPPSLPPPSPLPFSFPYTRTLLLFP